jgi:hypothetical protein
VVSLTGALFYGIVRFRIPAEVAIVVLAAVAADAVMRRRGTDALLHRNGEPDGTEAGARVPAS